MFQPILEVVEAGFSPLQLLDEIVNSQVDKKPDEPVAFIETNNNSIPNQEMDYDPYAFAQAFVVSTSENQDLDKIEDVPFKDLYEAETFVMYTSFGVVIPYESKHNLIALSEAGQEELCAMKHTQLDTKNDVDQKTLYENDKKSYKTPNENPQNNKAHSKFLSSRPRNCDCSFLA